MSKTDRGYITNRNQNTKKSLLEELSYVKTDLPPLYRHCSDLTTHKLFLIDPNPTATAPVGEIKEANHPGNDLQAFQLKEQSIKKKVKNEKSALSLQAFLGNSGWPGLISSPCIHWHRCFLDTTSTLSLRVLLRAKCAMCSFSNLKKRNKNMEKCKQGGLQWVLQWGHVDSSAAPAAASSCTPSSEGCGKGCKLYGAKKTGGLQLFWVLRWGS